MTPEEQALDLPDLFAQHLGANLNDYQIPTPSFLTMEGEFLEINLKEKTLAKVPSKNQLFKMGRSREDLRRRQSTIPSSPSAS